MTLELRLRETLVLGLFKTAETELSPKSIKAALEEKPGGPAWPVRKVSRALQALMYGQLVVRTGHARYRASTASRLTGGPGHPTGQPVTDTVTNEVTQPVTGGRGASLSSSLQGEAKEAAAAAVVEGSGTSTGHPAGQPVTDTDMWASQARDLLRMVQERDAEIAALRAERDELLRSRIAHRDLKPEKVLSRETRPRFGGAEELEPDLALALEERRHEKRASGKEPGSWADWEHGALRGLRANPKQVAEALDRRKKRLAKEAATEERSRNAVQKRLEVVQRFEADKASVVDPEAAERLRRASERMGRKRALVT